MSKALVLDCFGVILANAATIAFEQAGGDMERDGKKLESLYRAYDLGVISYQDEHEEIAQMLGISYDEWQTLMKDASSLNTPLVEYLKELNVPILILSNLGAESKKKVQSEYDFSFAQDFLVSGELGVVKPELEIYQIAAERLGLPTSECVFVDDNPNNVAGAQASGMQGVLYENVGQLRKSLKLLFS